MSFKQVTKEQAEDLRSLGIAVFPVSVHQWKQSGRYPLLFLKRKLQYLPDTLEWQWSVLSAWASTKYYIEVDDGRDEIAL